MSHLDTQLQSLKVEVLEMWHLVLQQMEKAQVALTSLDKDLAREVILNERRVNAYELKIDRDCENIFALFNPVAVDLRCVLAVLKINYNLERVGDIAEGICKFVLDVDDSFDRTLIETTRVKEMFEESCKMMEDVIRAFDQEDTTVARSVFKKDEVIDAINRQATAHVSEYIRGHLDNIEQSLLVLSIIRKLERSGDQIKNIAEEIIFYIEAKVLKHKRKEKKIL